MKELEGKKELRKKSRSRGLVWKLPSSKSGRKTRRGSRTNSKKLKDFNLYSSNTKISNLN
jgi:hypothetical protein